MLSDCMAQLDELMNRREEVTKQPRSTGGGCR
jgi:hypothetical protein